MRPSSVTAAAPPDNALPTAAAAPAAERRLDGAAPRCPMRVLGVEGDDDLSRRLLAAGIWPGAVIERIASAPFGDPVLFRVHGYRLALRRSEAERVRVALCSECDE